MAFRTIKNITAAIFSKIGRKLIIPYVIFSLLTLGLIAGLIYYDFWAQTKAIQKIQDEISTKASAEINYYVENILKGISLISNNVVYKDEKWEDNRKLLKSLMGGNPSIYAVSIINSKGFEVSKIVRHDPKASANLINVSGEDKFKKAIKGDIYLGPVYISQYSVPFISVSVPIRAEDNTNAGILAAEIDLSPMWETISQIKVKKTGYVYVVDQGGNLIAYKDINLVKKNLDMNAILGVKSFLNKQSITDKIYRSFYNRRVTGNWKPIASTGWGVIIELPVREVFQELIMLIFIGIISVVVVVILGIVISVVISRSIVIPLSRATRDLDMGSDQTASISLQMSKTSALLSESAMNQATSLQETSDSLSQINSMTIQNADNATKADRLSQEAKNIAESGGKAMVEMQQAIEAISDFSSKISKIIKTVREIAFQTNLLALNAAVEAAHAGEHGKGFAVVAGEVRNLAQRATEAVKDTTDLIENSAYKIKQSTGIISSVGDVLQNITVATNKTADIVFEIAAASRRQAEAVTQMTLRVATMDRTTQQNASAAEESAASAQTLASQADSLKDMVKELKFLVGESFLKLNISPTDKFITAEKINDQEETRLIPKEEVQIVKSEEASSSDALPEENKSGPEGEQNKESQS